jgi:multicomponent Na+:H+ antiporter subunit E
MYDGVRGVRSAGFLALLVRGVLFLALWIVLMGPALRDLPVGIVASIAATLASAELWAGNSRLSAAGLLRFVTRFVARSIIAGVDVARLAMASKPPVHPGFVRYRAMWPDGMTRSTFWALSSLQPGTLAVASEPDGTMIVHCLDTRHPVHEQIAADEAAFRAIFRD